MDSIKPYFQEWPAEKQAALALLDRMQQKAAQNLARLGVTEADVDRELQN